MKALIRRVLPVRLVRVLMRLRNRAQFRDEFLKDQERYRRHSAPDDALASRKSTGRNLEAQLTKDYHRVEKGLALRTPRTTFGAEVSARIDRLLPIAENGRNDLSYLAHVKNEKGEISTDVSPIGVSRPAAPPTDLASFFSSRHSVRDFGPDPVPRELLEAAVELAINTPSVCNRQTWHVRFFERPDEIRQALSFQHGSAPFAETVPAVALVTVDTQLFTGIGERNQGWIEGGLFSMSFVWALHGLGLDSCMLNMSQKNEGIDSLRASLNVPDNEIVIMMVAVGYGREGHRVARSPHRDVAHIIQS
jgi:nitroreductase